MKSILQTFIILLLFSNGASFAQDIRGIWLSSYKREIIKVEEVLSLTDEGVDEFVKLDSFEIDTFYQEAFILMDFYSKRKVLLKNFNQGKKCRYKVKNGELKVWFDDEIISGRVDANKIVLVDSMRDETYETLFEPIKISTLAADEEIDSAFFANTTWNLQTDSAAINYGRTLHFKDSGYVVITFDAGNHGGNSRGQYGVYTYKNHYFLGVFDREELEYRQYHIYSKNKSGLICDTYEHVIFAQEPPKNYTIQMEKAEFLTNNEFEEMELKLIGHWEATNNPLPVDSLFDIDTLLNQRYEFDFLKDKSYRLFKSATEVHEGKETYKEEIITGEWNLSANGKYITLKESDGWNKRLTIAELEEDYFKFYIFIKAFNRNWISNTGVEMIRKFSVN